MFEKAEVERDSQKSKHFDTEGLENVTSHFTLLAKLTNSTVYSYACEHPLVNIS